MALSREAAASNSGSVVVSAARREREQGAEDRARDALQEALALFERADHVEAAVALETLARTARDPEPVSVSVAL